MRRSEPAEPGVPLDLLDTAEAGPTAVRGGALRVAGYGVGVVLSLGSAGLLLRHLGVRDSGRYYVVASLAALASQFTEAGLTAIGMREWTVRDDEQRRRFLGDLLGLRIVLTIAAIAGATAFAEIAGYTPTMVAGTALVGLSLLLLQIQLTYAVPLMAGLRLGWVTLGELMRQAGTVALVVILVLLGASLLPFYAATIPPVFLALGLTMALVRGRVSFVPSFHVGRWGEVLRETLPFALATAVAAVYLRVAIIIVSLISSDTQLGYFSVSFRVVEVLVLVPQLVVSAGFPIFARAAHDDHDRLGYGLGRMFEICLALGLALALALAAAAPFLIRVIAGAKFAPAAPVLRIQGLTLVAAFTTAVWSYALLSLRRHREILLVNLGALVLSIVLTVVLASADGARGAAIATTVAEAVLTACLYVALRRSAPTVRPRVEHAARVVLAAAVAGATILVPGIGDAAHLVLALAVYAGALVAFGGLPPELYAAVRGRRAST
jgi:O-antigen/teichoic acid export membrane protein